MKVSRLPFPDQDQYWASNVVVGVGRGTEALCVEIFKGVIGIVWQPIKGAKESGFTGGVSGFLKGLGGLVSRPVKGVY